MVGAQHVVDLAREVLRVVAGQDLALARRGALDDVRPPGLVPLLRAHAVGDQRIDVFLLHQRQRLLAAEVVPRTLQADLLDDELYAELKKDLDKRLKKYKIPYLIFSAHSGKNLQQLKDDLWKLMNE